MHARSPSKSVYDSNWFTENSLTRDQGLCVSGGADSMCLAHLFQQIQDEGLSPQLHVQAFIVDHKARHESTGEAQMVSKFLERIGVAVWRPFSAPQLTRCIGIRSKILTMRWPEGALVSSLSNFETLARNHRYRMLAQASIQTGIQRLFLGHHEDDQIETILMRLIRSQKGSLASFEGIATSSSIPNTEYLMEDRSDLSATAVTKYMPWSMEAPVIRCSTDKSSRLKHHTILVNTLNHRICLADELGIALHRPLLEFPKVRILATCAVHGIPFLSDRTNFDPTVTLRNAVRFMMSNHKLPRALSRDSLLSVNTKARSRLQSIERRASEYFQIVQATAIDLRSGSLTVRFPRSPSSMQWEDPRIPARFLGQLLQVVSPTDGSDLHLCAPKSVVKEVFPGTANGHPLDSTGKPASVLTTSKVLLTRKTNKSRGHCKNDQDTTWRLSRQPFHRTELARAISHFTIPNEPRVISSKKIRSNWLLWDHRYWIRLCGTSSEYLRTCIVRPFQLRDSTTLRQTLAQSSKKLLQRFDTLLSDAAPGDQRYTLPIIVDDLGMRAFPTLNFSIPGTFRGDSDNDEWRNRLLSWQIVYKRVDPNILYRLNNRDSETFVFEKDTEMHMIVSDNTEQQQQQKDVVERANILCSGGDLRYQRRASWPSSG